MVAHARRTARGRARSPRVGCSAPLRVTPQVKTPGIAGTRTLITLPSSPSGSRPRCSSSLAASITKLPKFGLGQAGLLIRAISSPLARRRGALARPSRQSGHRGAVAGDCQTGAPQYQPARLSTRTNCCHNTRRPLQDSPVLALITTIAFCHNRGLLPVLSGLGADSDRACSDHAARFFCFAPLRWWGAPLDQCFPAATPRASDSFANVWRASLDRPVRFPFSKSPDVI